MQTISTIIRAMSINSTVRAFALYATLMALSALASAQTAQAGEYSFKSIEIFSGTGVKTSDVCRVMRDGELLAELPQFCAQVLVHDLSADYLVFRVIHQWNIYSGFPGSVPLSDNTNTYLFDKKSGLVTDILHGVFPRKFFSAESDAGVLSLMMIVDRNEYGFIDDIFSEQAIMRSVFEIADGRFTEVDPGPHVNWHRLLRATIRYISAHHGREGDAEPSEQSQYAKACGQLREIFSYIGSIEGVEKFGAGQIAFDFPLDKTNAEIFLDALREHSEALFAATGLSWLYKQGRYHVMENLTLLWSSDPEEPGGQLGIVPAPANQLLFVLSRPRVRPTPNGTTVWIYDRMKKSITSVLTLTAVTKIAQDDKKLIITEGFIMDEFDDPQQPLRSRLNVYKAGQWSIPNTYENTEEKYASFLEMDDIISFILRIHLKCRGNIDNCRHQKDLTRAANQKNALHIPPKFFERHTTSSILDENTLKEIPQR